MLHSVFWQNSKTMLSLHEALVKGVAGLRCTLTVIIVILSNEQKRRNLLFTHFTHPLVVLKRMQ